MICCNKHYEVFVIGGICKKNVHHLIFFFAQNFRINKIINSGEESILRKKLNHWNSLRILHVNLRVHQVQLFSNEVKQKNDYVQERQEEELILNPFG